MGKVLHDQMNTYDVYRLQHIFRLLGTRIIPAYFFSQNPMEFIKWQFNACRQTALITAYFFNKLMLSYKSEGVVVYLWDGNFRDYHTKFYNHAWITAEKVGVGNIVFIDVARVSTMTIVEFETRHRLPQDNSPQLVQCGTGLISVTSMYYNEMLKDTEFYTGKTGLEVCKDIEKMMHRYGYVLENFPWDIETQLKQRLAIDEDVPF